MVARRWDHRRDREGVDYAPRFVRLRKSIKYKAHLTTGSLTPPTTPHASTAQRRNSSFSVLPLNSLQTFSNLVKQCWMGKSCISRLFFMHFFHFPLFLKQKLCDHLKCCGVLTTSCALPPTPTPPPLHLSIQASLQHDVF